jgi:phosphate transport system permease protein
VTELTSRPGDPVSGLAALGGSPIGGGTLPSWAPYGIVLGSAVVVAAVLLALGSFGVAALLVLTVVASVVIVYACARSVEGARQAKDRAVTLTIVAAFGLAVVPLISLLYQVVSRGAARFDTAFFTESARGVVGEGGGASHAIVGTLVITGTATLISVPIGIMAAIYLTEYGTGRLRQALTFFVDVMTGIPSIVAGLFAYALFQLFFGPGIRLGIMGSVALAVLMVPIVIRTSEEILKIVPNHLREASYALGTPKWKTIVKIVLPTALAGLVTGVMIAIARIIGETAPLLVTTGVIDSVNANPLDGRMQNLAVYAYNEYKNPGVLKQASYDRAWAAALTLILIVMLLMLAARLIYRRFGTEIR